VFNLIRERVPESMRGMVFLLFSALVCAGVVAATPLDWNEWIRESLVLYGLAVGGYTALKFVETAGAKTVVATGCLLSFFTLGGIATSYAQDVPVSAGPVQDTARFWAEIGISTLNGFLGRLLKRLVGKIKF
jgi:hypothetical protein